MAELSGKTVLVTGATSGIGLEASVTLAGMGAELVLVGRDPAKAQAALAEVKKRSGSEKVSTLLCDFSSPAQIRALAEAFRAKHQRLDILVNNAGSVSSTRQVTADGLEQTFAVNHLGYFLLTNLLLDLLVKSAPARVVSVASAGHYRGSMDFDNLQFEKGGYSIMGAYSRSKLGNVLFTEELARKLAGKGVTANCLHPGAVATTIWTKAPWFAQPFLAVAKLFMVTPEQGGARIVYLATAKEVEGETGGYYEKDKKRWPSRQAQDPALAAKLWDVSARLTKLA